MVSFKGPISSTSSSRACTGTWRTELSYRQLEKLRQERGVGHLTIHRSVLKYAPQIEEAFQRRKRSV